MYVHAQDIRAQHEVHDYFFPGQPADKFFFPGQHVDQFFIAWTMYWLIFFPGCNGCNFHFSILPEPSHRRIIDGSAPNEVEYFDVNVHHECYINIFLFLILCYLFINYFSL